MTFHKTIKTLALTSVVALGMASAPALAQPDNVIVNSNFDTSSAITVTKVNDMDFGTWFVNFETGTTPTLVLSTDGSDAVTVGAGGGASQTIIVDDADIAEGNLLVNAPATGAILTMTASAITDIADTGLSLDIVSYETATETGDIITGGALVAGGAPVTIVAGGVDEAVALGGTIAITDTPDDGAHNSVFTVTLTY